MLGTVLDRITTLVGRSFVIAAFAPTLLFAVAMALTIAVPMRPDQIIGWWNELGTLGPLLAAASFLVLVACAYVLAVFTPLCTRLLEGQHMPNMWRRALVARHRADLQRRRRDITRCLTDLLTLQSARKEKRERLQARAQLQRGQPAAPVPGQQLSQVESLLLPYAHMGGTPDLKTLVKLSDALESDYQRGLPAEALFAWHRQLETLWADAEQAGQNAYAEALLDLQSRYAVAAGPSGVRASSLANVMAATWAYPYSRYGIDGVATWPKLQKVISKEYWALVEDARIAYEFCVCLTVLAFIYLWSAPITHLVRNNHVFARARSWSEWWGVSGDTVLCVAAIAILAAAATAVAYHAAYESARSLGTTLRTSFDLFRFPVLTELHVALPATLHDERKAWTTLNSILLYEDVSLNLDYKHPGA